MRHSLDVDAVVVDGGLTGITAALLLKEAGCRVALVERGRVGGIDTGCTTAHLHRARGRREPDRSSVDAGTGPRAGRMGCRGGRPSIRSDEPSSVSTSTVTLRGFQDFFTPMLTLTKRRSQTTISESALKWRLPRALASTSASSARRRSSAMPAMRVEHQAKFHPRKYLRGLLTRLRHVGCEVFEESEAEIGDDDGVKVGSHMVRAPWVVVATHNPMQGHQNFLQASLLQTKLALYATCRSSAAAGTTPRTIRSSALLGYTVRITTCARQCGRRDVRHCRRRGSQDRSGRRSCAVLHRGEAWLTRLAPDARHRTLVRAGRRNADFLPIIGTVAERQFIATGLRGMV